MPAGPKRLVIFDCDGVLVDSEPISNRILSEAISDLGWTLSDQQTQRRFHGHTLTTIQAEVERQLGRAVPAGWLEDFQARRRDAFQRELVAIPGAAQAVIDLRDQGIDVCVASQAALAKTRLTLTLTGLIDLFDPNRLFSATMVAHPKPAPDLFLHAAATCRHRPDSCTVIEDSLLGIRAAQAAGMRTLAYAPDTAPDALAQAGAEVVHSMNDIPRHINSTPPANPPA